MQGGVGTHEQAPDLMSLGRIDYQPFWIFYRGSELLDDPTQLKGKRIAVGPIGSGTRKVCEKILPRAVSLLKMRRCCPFLRKARPTH